MTRQVFRGRNNALPSGVHRRLTLATCSSQAAPKRRNAVTRGPLTLVQPWVNGETLTPARHCVLILARNIRRNMVKPGRYRHYKGNEYEVIGCARHSETEEEVVVYRALYGDRALWVRPSAMFIEHVLIDGKPVPRFSLLPEAEHHEH